MARLRQNLAEAGIDPEQVAYDVVDWYGPIQEQQEMAGNPGSRTMAMMRPTKRFTEPC